MHELALDDVDRHSFAREFDGVRVTQLMGSEPPPDAGVAGELSEFGPGGGRGPATASRRIAAVGAMFAGALAGALLLKADLFVPLALAAVLALVTRVVYVPAAVRRGSAHEER